MLNRENIDYVQSAIGYHFKNERLLVQAFIRKSYSQEHPEVQNNEVLEFYGDEALDLYITKILKDYFDIVFFCVISYNEVLEKQLNVMDMTAISIARDNNIQIMIFAQKEDDSIIKAVCGDAKCTIIK